MRKLFWADVFLGFLLCVKPLSAATPPADMEKKKQDSMRTARTEKLAIFRQSHPGVSISIDEVTGSPHQLLGDLSKGITQTDPVEIAYEFFEQNKSLYGMTNPRSELRVKDVDRVSPKMGGGTSVFLDQVYKGLKVTRGHFSVSINSSGKLDGVVGLFSPEIRISTAPSIDSLSAVEIAQKDLRLKNKAITPGPVSLSIFPFEVKYYLVWLVHLDALDYPFGKWEYFIDANSGNILYKNNRVIIEGPLPSPPPEKKGPTPAPFQPTPVPDTQAIPGKKPESSSSKP